MKTMFNSIVISLLLLSLVSISQAFTGKEDPTLTSLTTHVKELMKQQNVTVEGMSCIVVHSTEKAICHVRIKGDSKVVSVTVPYSKL